MSTKNKNKLINHVAFILDGSGSMSALAAKMRQVFASQLNSIKKAAKSSKQETRISVFHFGDYLKTVAFEADSDHFFSSNFYKADMGGTALISSTIDAINALAKIPQVGGDHSFLVYVETDGAETNHPSRAPELKELLDGLPDNWTVAITVPNQTAKHNAKKYGFPADNIEIWDTTEKGLEESTETINLASTAYYTARALGVKGTKSLFKLAEVTKTSVKKVMDEVDPGLYETLIVRPYDGGKAIKDFVETWTKKAYRVGSAYYQLTKPEKIQPSKVLAVIEKSTGKMFSGPDARTLLGLPDYEVKVDVASFKSFDVFVQSHSTNRKLVANTHLIVFK